MAASDRVSFSCTALVGTNKVGTIKPDNDGYYEVVLGALDVYNFSGQYWPASSAKEMFKASSSFMRRIARAALRSEYGHPKRDGLSIMEYAHRLTVIDERMVCCHIKDVQLDYNRVKDPDGRIVIAIIGKIRPSGPYAATLEAQLQNPHENVCFSIRAVTTDIMMRGRYEKNIKEIITWDYVNEPGISAANKYSSPSLEGIDSNVSMESLEETVVPLDLMYQYVQNQATMGVGMSMESADGVNMKNLLNTVGYTPPSMKKSTRPGSTGW